MTALIVIILIDFIYFDVSQGINTEPMFTYVLLLVRNLQEDIHKHTTWQVSTLVTELFLKTLLNVNSVLFCGLLGTFIPPQVSNSTSKARARFQLGSKKLFFIFLSLFLWNNSILLLLFINTKIVHREKFHQLARIRTCNHRILSPPHFQRSLRTVSKDERIQYQRPTTDT